MMKTQTQNERGAIVVEATIALTAYIFLIFTILSVVDICFIQAKMATSLDAAAKELSQYSFLYFKFGVDKYEKDFHGQTADSRQLATNTIDEVGVLTEAFTNGAAGMESGNFDQMYDAVSKGTGAVDSLVQQYGDAIADDPKAFLVGMGKLAGEELKEEAKRYLTQIMAAAMMKKNLISSETDSADNFLKRYRVVNGLKGLDFNYSTLMPYGSNEIILTVTYDVQVIQLLNIDYKFTFRQCAKTKAWGNGISKLNPQNNITKNASVWNLQKTARGKKIIENEKGKLPYHTDYGTGADKTHGCNKDKTELIHIMSMDTTKESYQKPGSITSKLKSEFKQWKAAVEASKDPILLKNRAGGQDTIDPGNVKSYRIILVVPDNSDMDRINKEVAEFMKANPGVSVDINREYGSPEQGQQSKNSEEEEE